MKISPALFGFEESTKISSANVDRLVDEMLGHYRKLQGEKSANITNPATPSFKDLRAQIGRPRFKSASRMKSDFSKDGLKFEK